MDLNKYQKRAVNLDISPSELYSIDHISLMTLGLCGESGEVAEKIKKVIRDNNGIVSLDTHKATKKELGDVLWYLAVLAESLNMSLGDVAKTNINKLEDREKRNVSHGSGDNR